MLMSGWAYSATVPQVVMAESKSSLTHPPTFCNSASLTSANARLNSLMCSRSRVGYDPAKVLEGVDDADFSWGRADTTEALTRVFILHPIGTGVLAIALLLSLLPGSTIASILAAVVSAVAFVINAVAVIVTFVVINLLLGEVREGTGDGRYGNAVWISLAAAALSLIATILLLFTCCAGRRRRARENRKSVRY